MKISRDKIIMGVIGVLYALSVWAGKLLIEHDKLIYGQNQINGAIQRNLDRIEVEAKDRNTRVWEYVRRR